MRWGRNVGIPNYCLYAGRDDDAAFAGNGTEVHEAPGRWQEYHSVGSTSTRLNGDRGMGASQRRDSWVPGRRILADGLLARLLHSIPRRDTCPGDGRTCVELGRRI